MAASQDEPDSGSGLETIEDPDNYNIRRRLKQLHDARVAVRETKDEVLTRFRDKRNRSIDPEARDRLIADKVTDYILELRPLLKKQNEAEEFLEEEIDTDSQTETLCINSWVERLYGDTDESIYWGHSMQAWDICNDYLEEVAGVSFEGNNLPRQTEFDHS